MIDGGFALRRIAASDGLVLQARDYGHADTDRLPLLCLAGISRNAKDFHGIAGREVLRRRVVALDYRGHGASGHDPDWRRYTAEVLLADTADVMAALGLARVVVLGTSLGGLLAMAMHGSSPASVAGIVLNDIGPELGSGTPRILERIAEGRPQPDWATAVEHLKRTLPPQSIADDAGWHDFARRAYREAPDGTLVVDWDPNLARGLSAAPVPDLWPLFRGLGSLPLMVVRGGLSDVLSEELLDRMRAAKPDLVAVTVPGVGHTPSLDEPDVRGPLDDFLARF